ncbi:DUF6397 family protein, partial [Streptomyces sp. TRM76130]|nr:DUF6397 family protein [Streptomyces sp. TRM76130]
MSGNILTPQTTPGAHRPRNWRRRHLGFLLRRTGDPWARAAAVASLRDPVEVAIVVRHPYERSHPRGFSPAPVIHGSPTARLAEAVMTAADPGKLHRLRAEPAPLMGTARGHRPAHRLPARRAAHRVLRGAGHHSPSAATTVPSAAAQFSTTAGVAAQHSDTPDTAALSATAFDTASRSAALGTAAPGITRRPSPARRRQALIPE